MKETLLRKKLHILLVLILTICLYGCAAEKADNTKKSADKTVIDTESPSEDKPDISQREEVAEDIIKEDQEDESDNVPVEDSTEGAVESPVEESETDKDDSSVEDIKEPIESEVEEIEAPEDVKYTYTDMTQTMYALSKANVRTLPNTEGTKLGTLAKAQEVTVTGQCNETKWYRIVFADAEGYVSEKYLSINNPTPPEEKEESIANKEEEKKPSVNENNNTNNEVLPSPEPHICVWDNGVVTKNPTCTSEGSKTYTCPTCKNTRTETIAKGAHNYVTTSIGATCTEPGKTFDKCSVCGDVCNEATSGDALGHDYIKHYTLSVPSCSGGAWYAWMCSRCGDINGSGSDPRLEHTPVGTVIQEGDCKNQQITVYHCGVCGEELRTEYTYPDIHDYVEMLTDPYWSDEKLAFVQDKVIACSRCNKRLE